MSLMQRFAIPHPIIQAPMLGVSTTALAAAVSNAGALGSIALSGSDATQAAAMIEETRRLTDKPFNANLFCHQPAEQDAEKEQRWLEHLRPLFAEFGTAPPHTLRPIYRSFVDNPEMLDMLLETRPAVVSFHFSLPRQAWLDQLKAAGIRLIASATDLDEGRQIERAGLDAIIAQGVEAGGHRGVFDPQHDARIGTLALVRTLATGTSLPIIAAGGIMDGQGIRAAQALGASAVQLGTAFISCPESSANEAYRQALRGPRGERTAITAAISGRPARGLPNRWFSDADTANAADLPGYPMTYDAAKALVAAAAAKGNGDFAVQWAGQGAPLARALPAAELVRVLLREMAEV
ncbi:NAD(P)H-dependent flavin oxidoreductase [Pseudomonas sp. LRF_L74]|uniref:NAD(P)H-dependent flavin oxidoreductase n=1 Tax=Pseudomonas sp. LRF_L74 TaxID=3369422 RepID=UPI003F5E8647